MVDVNMSMTPLKVIGREACFKLKVLLGYQKILDPKGVQTFEGGRSKRK
jgi:hypothetical protein